MGVNGDLMEQWTASIPMEIIEHHADDLFLLEALFLGQCQAEKNAITKHWEQYDIKADRTGDSQALIQLQREYCDKRQCLRCRFGYEFLRGKTKIEGYRNMAIEPDLFAELY